MSTSGLSIHSRRLLIGGGVVGAAALAFGLRGANAVLAGVDQARSLAASLRVQLNKSDDASNRAVMADTDEVSNTFARDAERASGRLERDLNELQALLRKLGLRRELKSLAAFQAVWAKYRKLDREILALAVQNTNLKAQRLSFGPAREAANGFRDALRQVAVTVAPLEPCRAEAAADHAILAVREIQILLAPHIVEADADAMTNMEQEMRALELRAREALATLTQMDKASTGPHLSQAVSALEHFKEVSAQIVELSRQNSNVRSLMLALRQKPALAAACDDSLEAVQEGLAKEGSQGTR